MAKKDKKNVKSFKLEQNELTPVTIGTFESRKKSSIGIFIILTIFVLVILFLPQISDVVNRLLDRGEAVNPGGYVNKPVTPPVGTTTPETEYYEYSEGMQIENDDIIAQEFVLNREQNILDLKIVNKKNVNVVLGKAKYYLELYNNNKTLLQRIKIGGNDNLAPLGYLSFTYNLNDNVGAGASLFALVKIEETEYPVKTIGEDGTGSLVCRSNNITVTYDFDANLLKGVSSEVAFKNDIEDYNQVYQDYKVDANKYNDLNGVTSTFFEDSTGFSILTTVDLSKAQRDYLFNADTFSLDTEARVVNFEMEAQGFVCN